jgi:glycerol-3-phosphate dehydrogenase
MRRPVLEDTFLEGRRPDVLVIGAGITGCAIARELCRYKLDILIVEKEHDVAMQASSRNDGMVHPGLDLRKGSLKHHYNKRGNELYDEVTRELGVPFERTGQYLCFSGALIKPLLRLSLLYWKWLEVPGARVIGRRELHRREGGLREDLSAALFFPTAGVVCPYNLTIAYAENAVQNRAQLSLDTAVLGMESGGDRITRVDTNRGSVYPRLVVNAAGVFADEIAAMAGDQFYTIHPRRGTNSILDKKCTGSVVRTIASRIGASPGKTHTKGGGVIRTAHGNLLVGPDAVETWERENYATDRASVEATFAKFQKTSPILNRNQIITYFTGVRAATYEEDFVVSKGQRRINLIHAAGIQSPGLTAAPAIARDIVRFAREILEAEGFGPEPNQDFNPIRKPIPHTTRMETAEREALIKQNPDYGVILCRCEEVSRGEILESLRRPVPCDTLDGVKRRVRPGMGRCQGGFCGPLILRLIAKEKSLPLEGVTKSGPGSPILSGPNGGKNEESGIGNRSGPRKSLPTSPSPLLTSHSSLLTPHSPLLTSHFSLPAPHSPLLTSHSSLLTPHFDVAVIGGGPAGLAAAIAADREGARVLLAEREARLGGILKQCIHDGFGLLRFGEKLSGPEYARRFIGQLEKTRVESRLLTFVSGVKKDSSGFELTLTGSGGMERVAARTLILSTGCRERTARQVAVHGTRPAGVLTAGAAQYYTNILGQLPARRCVILGSGDIGLIMARRLSLEGAEVLGVYEVKPTPSGLSRNIAQCLDDFDIPLYTSKTVTRVFGHERLEAVEIMDADKNMNPVPGTEERIPCDGLILSVGLIPENELAEGLGAPVHPATRGPICDQHNMTLINGLFSCGNALQVNDLVDYVSESGETAGRAAARFAAAAAAGEGRPDGASGAGNPRFWERCFADVTGDRGILCLAPQKLDLNHREKETTVYFRAADEREETLLRVKAGGREIFTKKYSRLRPPEMERITLPLGDLGLRPGDSVDLVLEDL